MAELNEAIFLELALIFCFALLGAVTKEYWKMINSGKGKVSFVRAIFASVTTSMIMLGFSDFVIARVGVKGLIVTSYLLAYGLKRATMSAIIDRLLKILLGVDISVKESNSKGNQSTPRRSSRHDEGDSS